MKTQGPATTEVFESLADEFTRALRNGDKPSIEEIADSHPLLSERIRLLFPMLALMEQGGSSGEKLPEFNDGFPEPRLERLGDFRIEREIGRGGMGIVYEAVQESLGRQVALKLLPQTSLDKRSAARFHQESRVAAMLHHTNIVPVYGVGQHEGYAYFVMQFIEGQSLDRVLVELGNMRSGTPSVPKTPTEKNELSTSASRLFSASLDTNLPTDRRGNSLRDTQTLRRDETDSGRSLTAVSSDLGLANSRNHYWINVARIGCQVASALAHAHSQKILHRDIKPSNLILDESGSVWVTDFGLARLFENDRLTRTGEVVGTLRYMPPEQMSGQSDLRGDIYGLGLTLYEMLVLRPAFNETDHRRLIAEVSDCRPTPPRKFDSRIPRDLETIVLKCIDREPEKRYQTAADLERDLTRFISGEPIAARRISTTERIIKWAKRSPAVASLALAASLFAVIGFAGISWKWREANRNYLESQKQAAAREVYFSKSLAAVDQMLTRVGSQMLANVPQMGQVRRELLNDALVFYNDLLQESGDDPALKREFGRIQKQVGVIHSRLGDQEKAAAAFRRAMETFAALKRDFPDDYSNVLDFIIAKNANAFAIHQIGKSNDAEIQLREVVKLLDEHQDWSESLDKNDLLYLGWLQVQAETHSYLATVLTSTRTSTEAIPELEIALGWFERMPKNVVSNSVKFDQATALDSLSSILERINQIPRSIKLRNRAIEIVDLLILETPESPEYRNRVATLHQSQHGILARQGKLVEASENLEQEIVAHRTLVEDFPNIPELKRDFARGLALYGSILNSTGNLEQGRQLMEESVSFAEQIALQFPDMVEFQHELAYVCQMMGTTSQLEGGRENLELSNAYYQKAYAINQRIVELVPSNAVFQYDLAMAAKNWSAALVALDTDETQARKLINEAIDTFDRLVKKQPKNTDYLYQSAFGRVNLAKLLPPDKVAECAEELEKAAQTFLKLIALQPQEPRYRLQLTRAYGHIAKLQFQMGQYNAWEDSLRRANQIMEDVVEKFGRDGRLVQFLTIGQNQLGHCIKTRNQVDEAQKLFQTSLEYRKAFVDENPKNERMTRQLASSHANLAWLWSYWKKGDDADLDIALQLAQTATDLDPKASEHWTCLAYVCFCREEFGKVSEVLSNCESVNKPDQMGRYAIQAMADWELSKQNAARSSLEKAEELKRSEEVHQNSRSRQVEPEFWGLVVQAAALIDP